MKAKRSLVLLLAVLLTVSFATVAYGAKVLTAVKVSKAPLIDGKIDSIWQKAKPIMVKDRRVGATIELRAVYTDKEIFILARYPDKREDRMHKPWVWDRELKAYKIGPQREDTFVIKWNMESKDVDLSNFADNDYRADVWYWKAFRTDPLGHASDKMHILSSEKGRKAQEVKSRTGKIRYLHRLGDQGRGCYKRRVVTTYQGDIVPSYKHTQPTGSRADVRAKGLWKDGYWTIEFSRALNTGHDDDVAFNPSSKKRYLFGVSIFGLYGEPIDNSREYFYGQGRISEKLYLVFK